MPHAEPAPEVGSPEFVRSTRHGHHLGPRRAPGIPARTYTAGQALFDPKNPIKLLDLGDIIGVDGELRRTKTGELSIFAERLDPARAEFYRERGLRTICPTSVAIDVLLESVRACEVRPPEPSKT